LSGDECACVTDGVFRQGDAAPPVFLTTRSITAADLAALTGAAL